MARIETVKKDEAEGIIKEAYDMFEKNIGLIPKPMEMMSASPALFEGQFNRIKYFSTHPTLSFALLAHIRFLVAHHLDYSFCTDFNKFTLKKLGYDDAQIEKMTDNPSASLLEEKEKVMLEFVIKGVKTPASVTDTDIEKLKALGWSDSDMLDAMAQGVGMIDHSIMMQVFGIDQTCLV